MGAEGGRGRTNLPPPSAGSNDALGTVIPYPHEGIYSDDFWEGQETEEDESLVGAAMEEQSEAGGEDDYNLARSEAST